MNITNKLLLFLFLLNCGSVVDILCEKLELNNKKHGINSTSTSSAAAVVVQEFEQNYKDEENQYIYIFNGLQKIESVPVRFPKDICLMKIQDTIYAASLNSDGEGGIYFNVFKYNYKDEKYNKIYNQSTPLAISMDCKEFNSKGYIALAYNLTSRPKILKNGSPVFEVANDHQIEIVQYFAEPFLTSVQFNIRGDTLFLVQTNNRIEIGSEMKSNCPIYKLEGTHFDLINRIPCKNSKRVAMFTIDTKIFIAVANYADEYKRTDTESHIYKYDIEENRFKLFQKIETFAVVDVDYFQVVQQNDEKQHFLVFANSKRKGTTTEEDSSEAYSVIYKYENDNFLPFQKLLLYEVQQFLQVQSGEGEFMLLVACDDQDIKLFQYNGWKFEESAVQLTEGALSKGISNMRYFDDLNETYIVIANENMLLNEPNIFTPIYKKYENETDIKMDILDWCKEIYKKHSEIDLNKLKTDLESIKKPVEALINGTTYKKFETAKIDKAFVNKLIYPRKNLTPSFWNTIINAQKLLQNLNSKIISLSEKLDLKHLIKEIEDKIILVGNNTSQQSNEDEKEVLLQSQNQLKNDQKIFENLSIENLFIKSDIKVKNINGIPDHKNKTIKLNEINATKIIVKNSNFSKPNSSRVIRQSSGGVVDDADGNTKDENKTLKKQFINLKANKLNVTGNINDINLNLLYMNLLRKFGDQIITAPINIKNLTANSITTTDNRINEWNTDKLVLTNKGKSYVVNQGVQFTETVRAKNVNIKNRINNIHILDDKLDVLLTNTNETQKITGRKIFNEIDLLEPLHVGGKIIGSQISKVSPLNPVHDNYVLSGDYTITGDVTIVKQLIATNIFGIKSTKHFNSILENGLQLTDNEIPLEINFLNNITANNIYLKIINNINSENFLKNNFNKFETIDGIKTFTTDLNIQGNLTIKQINGINVNDFQENIFKISDEENIMKNIHVDKIIIPSITSTNISLGGIDLSEILTKDSDQIVSGKITIDNLIGKNITIENLSTNKLIFGENIDIFKIKKNHQNDQFINSSALKLQSDNDNNIIKIKNLILKKSLNQISIKIIEDLMKKLNDEISLIGPVNFKNKMEIIRIQINGELNGIHKEEFGKAWLIKDHVQEFTAPQHFESIQCHNIEVAGNMNKIPIKNFYNHTYWLNRDENVNFLNFDSLLEVEKFNVKTLNNDNFPNKFLLTNSSSIQKLNTNSMWAHNIHVKGNLSFNSINNLNIMDFEKFLQSDRKKIAIEYAIFDEIPKIETINGKNIKNLIDTIWLKDTNSTILTKEINFKHAITRTPINFQNLVNSVNLSYAKQHYISMNKDQTINVPVKFSNKILFEEKLSTSIVKLNGNIIINSYETSTNSFDLKWFFDNTLKFSDVQTIIGQWNIDEVYIEGHLNNVSINGLNLQNDVMRYDSKLNNITAFKYFENLKIEKLYTNNNEGIVNKINISNWIHNTVYVYDNFTIEGLTIIDKTIIYNNIDVIGLINGIPFKIENLLLKSIDQSDIKEINLKIITKNLNKQQIFQNIIENLTVQSINGRSVEKLYNNINQNITNITIYGDLIFEKSLNVENFNGNDYFFDLNTKDYFDKLIENSLESKAEKVFNDLNNIIQKIKINYEDSSFYLKKFENVQTIYGNIKKVISLTISIANQLFDYAVVLSGSPEDAIKITLYLWNTEINLFVENKKLHWIGVPEQHSIININKIILNGKQLLLIETYFESFFYQNLFTISENGLLKIYELHSNSSRQFLENHSKIDEISNIKCLHTYSQHDSILSELCLKTNDNFATSWSFHLPLVTQVAHIEKTYFATLKSNSIEIRDYSRADILHQRLNVEIPIYINIIPYQNHIYMAIVCSKRYSNSLYSGSVEIYRSSKNLYFERLQILLLTNPIIAKFQVIPESEDLLLHVLTDHVPIPLAIYHYKGIIGFQQVVESSTIPKGLGLEIVNLRGNNKYMIGVEHNRGLNLIEFDLDTA